MENKPNNKHSDYVVVSTKVSESTFTLLHRIAAKKGLSVYELNQMMLDTIVRYMDDSHNLTPEMEQAMSIFEHLDGWNNAFNLADPSAAQQVEEAVYFLTAEGKKGARAVHVQKPYFGIWEQTDNVQQILERVLSLTLPERYRRLRRLAVESGCTSILQLLDRLIDEHSKDSDTAEFRKSFEDARRSEFGRKPHEGEPYVRKKHRTPDSVANSKQQTINFDTAEDRQAADHESGRKADSDWQPYGY